VSEATNAFEKARAKAYGDVGTDEIGFSGMGGAIFMTGDEIGGSLPTKVYSGTVSVFEKYFVAKRVHIGYAGLGNMSLSYDEAGKNVAGNGMATLLAQAGYAFPLSPWMQLDLTGGLGAAALFYTWTPIWAFVYNGQAMLLFPIGENANLGFGGLFLGMNVKGELDATTYLDVKSFTANAVAQISIYF
jgi:hypothetical protein